MKLIVVQDSKLDENPGVAMQLMKQRQAGNLVVLLSSFCRTKTVELYYRHANMFVVDRGMFAFSGCHTLYHQALQEADVAWLKDVLKDVPCAIYDEVENACGGAMKLFEQGKWKERPYLMIVEQPGDEVCCLFKERFDVLDVQDGRIALFPKGINYAEGIAACAEEAGVGKEDIILW